MPLQLVDASSINGHSSSRLAKCSLHNAESFLNDNDDNGTCDSNDQAGEDDLWPTDFTDSE